MKTKTEIDTKSAQTHWFNNVFQDASVLVTGHTGFKGSWITRWLSLCGANIHGFALDPGDDAILYDQLDLSSQLVVDHRGDLQDLHRLKEITRTIQPEFVFHLAAQPLVRHSYDAPVETFTTNVLGTVNVLESLREVKSDCTAVIVTTDKCYANQEWLHGYREEDPLGGRDPYSASKAAAEIVTASYRDSYFRNGNVKVASARAGNVIGGGDWASDRIVPDCIRAIRSGTSIPVRNRLSTRPWQHVLEPLSGYLWLAARMSVAKTDDQGNQAADLETAFNFGPQLSSNRSVADLVSELTKHFPGGRWHDASDPSASHEAGRLDLAIAKAHHQLGWQPVWDFAETVQQTAKWYRDEEASLNLIESTDRQIHDYAEAARLKELAWARGENVAGSSSAVPMGSKHHAA